MPDDSALYELEPDLPDLTGSVMVQALDGFVDAGAAKRLAREHLLAGGSRVVARFDVDALLDYRARRPAMTFDEDHWADYADPELAVHLLTDSEGTPYLLLAGPEPDVRWEAFTAAVRSLVQRLGVRLVVGLNAIPMAVPHTRALGVIAHATRPELVAGHDKWVGTVQVPSSAGHLLEYRLGQAGHDAAGFAVAVPHYLAEAEYPAAALVLLASTSALSGLVLDRPGARDARPPTCAGRSTRPSPAPTRCAAWSRRWSGSTTRSARARAAACWPRWAARCRPPRSSATSWSASWPSRRARAPSPPAGRAGRQTERHDRAPRGAARGQARAALRTGPRDRGAGGRSRAGAAARRGALPGRRLRCCPSGRRWPRSRTARASRPTPTAPPSDRDVLSARTSPLVVLDEPRAAGNVGAVVRVAAAADAAGVLVTGTLDPWHPAVLRGSAGLHYALPVLRGEPDDVAGPVVVLDADGDPDAPLPPGAVLVVGSERQGVSAVWRERAEAVLALPMRPGVSSLNLATAVAAALYRR